MALGSSIWCEKWYDGAKTDDKSQFNEYEGQVEGRWEGVWGWEWAGLGGSEAHDWGYLLSTKSGIQSNAPMIGGAEGHGGLSELTWSGKDKGTDSCVRSWSKSPDVQEGRELFSAQRDSWSGALCCTASTLPFLTWLISTAFALDGKRPSFPRAEEEQWLTESSTAGRTSHPFPGE